MKVYILPNQLDLFKIFSNILNDSKYITYSGHKFKNSLQYRNILSELNRKNIVILKFPKTNKSIMTTTIKRELDETHIVTLEDIDITYLVAFIENLMFSNERWQTKFFN